MLSIWINQGHYQFINYLKIITMIMKQFIFIIIICALFKIRHTSWFAINYYLQINFLNNLFLMNLSVFKEKGNKINFLGDHVMRNIL